MMYSVEYSIDIDADTPQEAAELALKTMRDVSVPASLVVENFIEVEVAGRSKLHRQLVSVDIPPDNT